MWYAHFPFVECVGGGQGSQVSLFIILIAIFLALCLVLSPERQKRSSTSDGTS
jgi:hypothetical protein